jgi:hypothetical protein
MPRGNTSVFGMYRDQEAVSSAVEVLKYVGFRIADIAILEPANTGSTDLAHVKRTKAPEGASTGALLGAIVGGVLGWLAGIGTIVMPGTGPFVAAGPIMTMLSGIAVFGILGGLIGALAGASIPEYEAKRYKGRVRGGRILLSVHCNDTDFVKRAEDVLHRTRAVAIGATSESKADFVAVGAPPELR